jgi:hypothetical protein
MAGIRHTKVLHQLERNCYDVHPCFGTSSDPLGLTRNNLENRGRQTTFTFLVLLPEIDGYAEISSVGSFG